MQRSLVTAARQSPAIASSLFILYLLLASALIWYSEKTHIAQERQHAAILAGEHALAIQMGIGEALSSAYALGTMVRLNKGDVPNFETVTTALRTFYPGISALQLAPDGVITQVAPLAGNEKAIGHNLLADPQRDKEAFLARDTGKLTLAGPFPLIQGGIGAVGRLPVYLDDPQGKPRFWGFVAVLIRLPDALVPARLPELTERGYQYELWRVHPDTGKKHVIAASTANALRDPVERTLDVPNATWTLSIEPADGWTDRRALTAKVIVALLLLMLLAASWRALRW